MFIEIMQRIVDDLSFYISTIDIGWAFEGFSAPILPSGLAVTSNEYFSLFIILLFLILNYITIVYFVLLPFIILARFKVFKKANEKGYKSFIPFYSRYILYKIGMDNGWYFIFSFIPIANIIVHILMCLKLSKKFDLNKAFTIGLILLFPLFLMILGFNKRTYMGNTLYDREIVNLDK